MPKQKPLEYVFKTKLLSQAKTLAAKGRESNNGFCRGMSPFFQRYG